MSESLSKNSIIQNSIEQQLDKQKIEEVEMIML